MAGPPLILGAVVEVGKSYDVILPEVRPGLHFYDLQRLRAGIGETVLGALWNVGRLICLQGEHLLPVRHMRSTRDDDSVLAPVVMELQTQSRSRIHDKAFHFKMPALVEDRVPLPGAVHSAVAVRHFRAAALQALHDGLDLLCAVPGANEERVIGVDHQRILEPDRGDGPPAPVHEGVLAPNADHILAQAVPALVPREQAVDGSPLA